MWRPNDPVEDDVSAAFGIDPQGKRRRSRRRAWRDGLADQTVVQGLEHVRSYRAFERALIDSVDPRSALELVFVHRLASLLWRLRRACAIETGLFDMQSEIRSACRQDPSLGFSQPGALQNATGANGHSKGPGANGRDDLLVSDQEPLRATLPAALGRRSKSRTIAQRFLRLSNLDPTLVDRASNYEERLWRQATQTILTLDAMRRPPSAPARRLFRRPMVLSYWGLERSLMR
jgi:hypothetical protein